MQIFILLNPHKSPTALARIFFEQVLFINNGLGAFTHSISINGTNLINSQMRALNILKRINPILKNTSSSPNYEIYQLHKQAHKIYAYSSLSIDSLFLSVQGGWHLFFLGK